MCVNSTCFMLPCVWGTSLWSKRLCRIFLFFSYWVTFSSRSPLGGHLGLSFFSHGPATPALRVLVFFSFLPVSWRLESDPWGFVCPLEQRCLFRVFTSWEKVSLLQVLGSEASMWQSFCLQMVSTSHSQFLVHSLTKDFFSFWCVRASLVAQW